ncbi:hypothetical protein [Zobellella denitrificans]|uniref:hypothetical protein n=1 Tax=Zobellella denitrificans TaxID=347534 RepID=UPI0012FD244F|nr:hypothetical protein [Zobellella denitrificans]
MSRKMDYIYDVSEGWVYSEAVFEEVLGQGYSSDHAEAIKAAGYAENQFEKVNKPALIIEHYKGSFDSKFPYLLSVSDEVDVNLVLIPNFISLQKCISELFYSNKTYLAATKS